MSSAVWCQDDALIVQTCPFRHAFSLRRAKNKYQNIAKRRPINRFPAQVIDARRAASNSSLRDLTSNTNPMRSNSFCNSHISTLQDFHIPTSGSYDSCSLIFVTTSNTAEMNISLVAHAFFGYTFSLRGFVASEAEAFI